MYAMVRYFRGINKKSCKFTVLDSKRFFWRKRLEIRVAGMPACRYANMARLATKAIFFK